eukprot:scaffold86717_cov28-Tisochrysis_lutea.AAC.3
MRVEEHIGRQAGLSEGHILLRPQSREDALLPVPSGELVARNGVPVVSEADENGRRLGGSVSDVAVAAHEPYLLHDSCAARLSA